MNHAGAGAANSDIEAAMRIAARELGAQPARLYLFGSRARGDAASASDIDIAILPDTSLEPDTDGISPIRYW
jgi:predicted nucleotidyltransferase